MKELDALLCFVDHFNNTNLYASLEVEFETYAKDVKTSLEIQLGLSKRTYIGLSELGKPAVLLGMRKLGYQEKGQKLKNIFRCHLGEVFESLLLHSLVAYLGDSRYVIDTQREVNFKGYIGHVDAVINDSLVVEIKTMSSYYWNKFVKNPNDEKGYITQLALYSEALCLPAVWLCLNIETYELKLIELSSLSDELVQEKINRASAIITSLSTISTFEELFENFAPPVPEKEFFRKQPTGKFVLPESMKYSNFCSVFYVLSEGVNGYGKQTVYVDDYTSYEEAKEALSKLYEIPF